MCSFVLAHVPVLPGTQNHSNASAVTIRNHAILFVEACSKEKKPSMNVLKPNKRNNVSGLKMVPFREVLWYCYSIVEAIENRY